MTIYKPMKHGRARFEPIIPRIRKYTLQDRDETVHALNIYWGIWIICIEW